MIAANHQGWETHMSKLLTRSVFAPPVDQSAVADAWGARGYSCHMFTDPPGQAWLDFVHQTNELVTVVDGRLQLTVDDDTVVAEPGDEIFIPRRAVHSVRNIHHGTMRWLFGYDN